MSEILGTVFERDILTSSLGTEPSPERFQQGGLTLLQGGLTL